MIRRIITWTALVISVAGMVLNTSLEARQQQDRLAEINREINAEQERIRVLTAEWHSLKNPERLEALARRHLQGYGTIKPMQMAALDAIPEHLPEVTAPAASNVAAVAVQPSRQVASVVPPRAQPAARPIARPTIRPAVTPAPAQRRDELATLIAQADAPAATAATRETPRENARPDDGIRTLIEREQPQGIQRTSFTGAQ